MSNQMAYVGRCVCGNIVAAMADNLRRKEDVAKEIASWIIDGLTIEHLDADEVRVQFSECTCEVEE